MVFKTIDEVSPKREKRLYSLYVRQHGTKQWYRVSAGAYPKTIAVHMYQSLLINISLGGTFEPRLKVIGKRDKMLADLSEMNNR